MKKIISGLLYVLAFIAILAIPLLLVGFLFSLPIWVLVLLILLAYF